MHNDRGESDAECLLEARPKGRPQGSAIEDYVVEDHADHVLATFKTLQEAIDCPERAATPRSSRACGT
jgi:hypothetical protein